MTRRTSTRTEVPQGPQGPLPQTYPSWRAPNAATTPFRRRSADPTLGDGAKTPTTLAWAPTPTLTDHRVLDGPAFVVAGTEGAGARVAAGLSRLGRPVEVLAPPRPGDPAGHGAGPMNHPLVVHVAGTPVDGPTARAVTRSVTAYRPGATITYDLGAGEEGTGSPEDARARVEGLIARSDVVRARAGDLDRLYPGEEHRRVVGRWLSSGPGIVIVSGGGDGTWAVNAVGTVATSPGKVGEEADGGAFMAGVIDALWHGGLLGVWARDDLGTLVPGSLRELVDNATAAAAITSRNGQPPTRAELDDERGIPQIAA